MDFEFNGRAGFMMYICFLEIYDCTMWSTLWGYEPQSIEVTVCIPGCKKYMEVQPSIEYYRTERIPNPYPAGDLPWTVYYTVRNAVVRCCREFGKVGPLGECPVTGDHEPRIDEWLPGDADPIDFFVIDDQYNHEQYVYVEIVEAPAFEGEWLRRLMQTLTEFPGWGAGILAFKSAYILVFADKIMVTGSIFENCRDFDGVVRQGQAELAKYKAE